ncbi:MAG: hypothetical protein RLZZ399_2546 [Verrucomicrobiota bacterium]|jgi:hypothetical protein
MKNSKFSCCDGVARRDFLRVGAITGFGMGFSLQSFLTQEVMGAPSLEGAGVGLASGSTSLPGKAKAAIFVRMAGGPSHMDTFDLKPDAPDTHRGEFKPIATNADGVQISEHLPRLAQCADKFALLRGVSHTLADHNLGSLYMGTGNRPIASLHFPAYGAVVSKELGGPRELPAFVALPSQGNNPTGYLGVEYGPFDTGAAPTAGRGMDVRGLALRGVTLTDVDRRQDMVRRYDTAFGDFAQEDKILSGMDEFGQKAYQMMRSEKARQAFDLRSEPQSISGLFGNDAFSQSCLMATRLVEAGVRFVTVQSGGWDTHADNFAALRDRRLPEFDRGLSGLLLALAAKGLLETTAVYVTGEFGRTPKINARAGRDHYPRAMFCLLAGGGVRGGQVLGASDAKGEGPLDRVITPDDVATTFYAMLGIDARKEYLTPSGRPVMIVRHGEILKELL